MEWLWGTWLNELVSVEQGDQMDWLQWDIEAKLTGYGETEVKWTGPGRTGGLNDFPIVCIAFYNIMEEVHTFEFNYYSGHQFIYCFFSNNILIRQSLNWIFIQWSLT